MRKMYKKLMVFLFTGLFCITINISAVDLSGALFSHDPATIIEDSGTYWHFYTAPGVGAATSKNLSGWSSSNKRVFTAGTNWKQNYPAWTIPYFGTTNTDGNIWAPDVIYMNGAYYLYYSCSSFGSSNSAIGVVKSSSLNNPQWEDLGKVVSSGNSSQVNAIDPGMFRDDDGKVYMVYGSWSGGIGIVDIDSVSGLATSTVTTLYGGGGLATEAPALFKEGSYYYLVVNRDRCCIGLNSTYYILVGRSTNVKGPYTGFKTLLPNKDGKYVGPGHFSLLRDKCANYVSIHYYDGTAGGAARLDILKMKMVDGWPILYRDFTFDNCYDELRSDAGSDAQACLNLPYNLATSETPPKSVFYSTLSWDDGDAEGSFNNSTTLQPIYTPPADFLGNVTLTLTATSIDSGVVITDSMILNIIENTTTVDAGSDEETDFNAIFNFSNSTTAPSVSNSNSLLWDDGGAGGKFVNKTVLMPIYTPPTGYSGPLTLTLSAFGTTNCVTSDSMILMVKPLSIRKLEQKDLRVFPNPSDNGSFSIELTNNQIFTEKIAIDIYKSDGSKAYSKEIEMKRLIDIDAGLGSGIYLVLIKTRNIMIYKDRLLVK